MQILSLWSPNVFLKYNSVNSECTPVIRKGAGLINSVLWMRKLAMSSLFDNVLDSVFFSVASLAFIRQQ